MAEEKPDFSGNWTASPPGSAAGGAGTTASLGSGWGDSFTLFQEADRQTGSNTDGKIGVSVTGKGLLCSIWNITLRVPTVFSGAKSAFSPMVSSRSLRLPSQEAELWIAHRFLGKREIQRRTS